MYYVYCGNGCAYSNELYHGRITNVLNNVRREGSKYIEKIKTDWGDRYFYTQQELDAYLRKARKGIENRVGITAKNNYRESQNRYNTVSRANRRYSSPGLYDSNHGYNGRIDDQNTYQKRQSYERSVKADMDRYKNEYDNSLIGRFDHFVENASMTISDLRSRASSYISQGRAKVQSMISTAQTRMSDLISTARSKASEYGSAAIAKAKSYYHKGKWMLTELFKRVKNAYMYYKGRNGYDGESIGPKQPEIQGPTYQKSAASYLNPSNYGIPTKPPVINPSLKYGPLGEIVKDREEKKKNK